MVDWILKTLLGSYLKKGVTLNFLDNYKTYILCVGAIAVALIGVSGGGSFGSLSIPAMTPKEAIEIIWVALGGITIRKALPKKEKPEDPGPPEQPLVTGV